LDISKFWNKFRRIPFRSCGYLL